MLPGSLGIPILGQSLELLRAKRADTSEQRVQAGVHKYGLVPKLSLFGKPTVLIHGPATNKLMFTGDGCSLVNQQTQSVGLILGERNLPELSGEDHKRVRNALVSFLKPKSLKQYVKKMDPEVRMDLENHWIGKQKVQVRCRTQSSTEP